MQTKQDRLDELKAIKDTRFELEQLKDSGDIDAKRNCIARLMSLYAVFNVNHTIGILERSLEVIDFDKEA